MWAWGREQGLIHSFATKTHVFSLQRNLLVAAAWGQRLYPLGQGTISLGKANALASLSVWSFPGAGLPAKSCGPWLVWKMCRQLHSAVCKALTQVMKRKGGFRFTVPEDTKVVIAFLSEIDGFYSNCIFLLDPGTPTPTPRCCCFHKWPAELTMLLRVLGGKMSSLCHCTKHQLLMWQLTCIFFF